MKVLVVDDERNIRESLQRLLALESIDSACADEGRSALELLKTESFDAVVADLRMPGMGGQELLETLRERGLRCPVIIVSAFGEISDAVKALKSGANDYLIKPFDPEELIYKLKTAVSNRRREDQLEAGARTGSATPRFIGESEAARGLRHSMEKLARTDTTVLITGESGSGKEVVAREIHALSPRSQESFVAVNVGGIHENLMESELFGHEKGAFTGADARKIGLFELAGAGSLFLDEIGEMPLSLQVKLLRVLQERKIRRLGGTVDIPVGARILSATNKDIEERVREGSFREDLYYRLNVARIHVPPLRDRRGDIALLSGFLLEKLRLRMGRAAARLGASAMDALAAYSFPGNVRELENILERALIYVEDVEILASDLDLAGSHRGAIKLSGTEEKAPARPAALSLDDLERASIESALEKWEGNRTKAAEELGISRRTMLYRLKRYGLH